MLMSERRPVGNPFLVGLEFNALHLHICRLYMKFKLK